MFIRHSKWVTRCLRCQFHLISLRPQSHKLCAPRSIESTQRPFSTGFDPCEKDDGYHNTGATDGSSRNNAPMKNVTKPRIGETTSLGIDTLGEHGQVFVLGAEEILGRERARTKGSFLNNTAKRRLNDNILLKQLDAEESELSDSSYAKHNLECLRSTRQAHDALLKKEWVTLRKAIMDGFTFHQLSNYIRNFGNGSMEMDQPIWLPDESTNLTGRHSPNPNIVAGKQYLAEKVMRVCWKLEVEGEIGQLYIRVDSPGVAMLLNPKRGPLGDISETYGVKIDVSRSQNVVSITGDRYSCESACESICHFTSRVSSATRTTSYSRIFSGDDRRFDKEFLEFLRLEYGVSCEKKARGKNGKDGSDINVAYLCENAQDAEEMRRSLGLGFISAGGLRTSFRTNTDPSEEALLSPVNAPDSLSWLERRKKWFRWNKPEDGSSNPRPLSSLSENAALRGTVEQDLRGRPGGKGRFLPMFDRLNQRMTATVGKFLFPNPPPTLKTKWITAGGLKKMASRRTFIDDIPKPNSFLIGLHEDSSRTSHKVRLIPSPFNPFEAPPIELELDMSDCDPFQKPTLKRASAIVFEEDTDLLLPHNTLDVRFTRSLHCELLPQWVSAFQDETNATLESILKSMEGFRYRLPLIQPQPSIPPFCRLNLPKDLLQARLKKASIDKLTSTGELIEVEYMFPPSKSILGFRQGVFSYEGCDLNFAHSFNGPVLANQKRSISLAMEGRPKLNPTDFRAFGSIFDHGLSLASELGRQGKEDAI